MAAPTEDQINAALVTALTTPASVRTERGEVTMRSADDVLKIQNSLAAQAAVGASGSAWGAVSRTAARFVPSGPAD